MTDGQLVHRTLAGANAAFDDLVGRWARRVGAVCHARLGRRGPAEDMVQEAFLRAFRGLSTLAAPERFGAWVCGIASRACLDWLKAKERTQVAFSDLAPGSAPDAWLEGREEDGGAAERLEEDEETRRLLGEIDLLPEEEREVLLLFYYESMTYTEIGVLLGVSPGAVNKRLTRARGRLRLRLSRSEA
jgi:RNA polymerase sigma-70 factor (ECF subfamily)